MSSKSTSRLTCHEWQASYWIFCDFDGTISRCDATDELLEAFAQPEWRVIEDSWRSGDITAMECMKRQVDLLRCSKKKLDTLVNAVAIDPWFVDFVSTCRDIGVPLTVLSDGLDYVIKRVFHNNGLSWIPFYANKFEILGGGRYSLTFPHARERCFAGHGTCKCALIRRLRSPDTKIILVGDGASDFCAAREAADFVFAKGSLLKHCRELNVPHAAYDNFLDIKEMLLSLQPGEYDITTCPLEQSYQWCINHD